MARRDTHTIELSLGLVLTIGIHAAFVVVAVLVGGRGRADAGEDPDWAYVNVAELLRWGEVMPDPNELPWISNPAPAPREEPRAVETPPEQTTALPEEAVVLEQTPAEQPRETELRSREEEHDPEQEVRTYRGQTNPNRPTNDDPTVGSAEGFEGGTSLSPDALRNMLSEIQSQLQRAFRPPSGMTDEELAEIQARVLVRVSSDGQVTGWDVTDSSGDRRFDMQIERLLNRFRMGSERLRMSSVSDPGIRARLETQGFTVTFRGDMNY